MAMRCANRKIQEHASEGLASGRMVSAVALVFATRYDPDSSKFTRLIQHQHRHQAHDSRPALAHSPLSGFT